MALPAGGSPRYPSGFWEQRSEGSLAAQLWRANNPRRTSAVGKLGRAISRRTAGNPQVQPTKKFGQLLSWLGRQRYAGNHGGGFGWGKRESGRPAAIRPEEPGCAGCRQDLRHLENRPSGGDPEGRGLASLPPSATTFPRGALEGRLGLTRIGNEENPVQREFVDQEGQLVFAAFPFGRKARRSIKTAWAVGSSEATASFQTSSWQPRANF